MLCTNCITEDYRIELQNTEEHRFGSLEHEKQGTLANNDIHSSSEKWTLSYMYAKMTNMHLLSANLTTRKYVFVLPNAQKNIIL